MSPMAEPLPGMPVPPPKPSKNTPAGIRAARIRPMRLCEKCCMEIHELGVSVAPYPRIARWRVVQHEAVWRLCEVHKNEACDGE